MTGTKLVFHFLLDNWLDILIGLLIISIIIEDIRAIIKRMDTKKIVKTLEKISGSIASYVNDAEMKWAKKHIVKAGAVKRAEVISKIYEKYPELSDYVNQELIINSIDELIDNALKGIENMRKDDTK